MNQKNNDFKYDRLFNYTKPFPKDKQSVNIKIKFV